MTTPTEGTDPNGQDANTLDKGTGADKAPEAAPPAPVALDDKPPSSEPPASSTDEAGIVTYDPTGDAGLDVALAFVGKLGIGMDDPAMKATAEGDFSLIKAKLATMGDKAQGWEQMVALAEKSYSDQAAKADQKATAIRTAVHQIAGGEDRWNTVKSWASTQAAPEEKAELNAMFDAGPVQARAAAQMLVDLYAKANGTVVEPASATTNPGAALQSNANGNLSPREYADAVAALSRKVGSHNLHTHPDYIALGRRLRG